MDDQKKSVIDIFVEGQFPQEIENIVFIVLISFIEELLNAFSLTLSFPEKNSVFLFVLKNLQTSFTERLVFNQNLFLAWELIKRSI